MAPATMLLQSAVLGTSSYSLGGARFISIAAAVQLVKGGMDLVWRRTSSLPTPDRSPPPPPTLPPTSPPLLPHPQVLAAVAAALGKPVASLTVESYRTQVVAGLNYRVLCRTDGGEAVVATAFKPLPHTGAPLEVKGAVAGGEL